MITTTTAPTRMSDSPVSLLQQLSSPKNSGGHGIADKFLKVMIYTKNTIMTYSI